MLSSAGLPLLNGFVGEFTILQGAFEAEPHVGGAGGAGRHLRRRVPAVAVPADHAGQVTNGKNLGLPDMNLRELAMFVPLIAWAVWIGVYPKPYFDILEKPVAQIVERVRPGYFAGNAPQNAGHDPAPAAVTPPEVRNEPVLHFHRSLRHHPGDHAGAVRLRHPAVRFPGVPGAEAAQVAAAVRGAGRDFHRLRAVAAAGVSGGQRARRS